MTILWLLTARRLRWRPSIGLVLGVYCLLSTDYCLLTSMHPRFGLTLVVTHACNLRCSYCYAGSSRAVVMSDEMARHAIRRGAQSVAPNGRLELGFFGGEPMLETDRIAAWMAYAAEQARAAGIRLAFSITTNGTQASEAALAIMTHPDVTLAISFDGLPATHDRHRRSAAGQGTSPVVLGTIQKLIDRKAAPSVIMVVRPDTVGELTDGFRFLIDQGIRKIEPTLDLWAQWNQDQMKLMEDQIARAADLWRAGLPTVAISWFDHKALEISLAPRTPPPRCGYGHWELTVAPSGRMYPCERMVGDDSAPSSPSPGTLPSPSTLGEGQGEGLGCEEGRGEGPSPLLPGHVTDAPGPFTFPPAAEREEEQCTVCEARSMCSTDCRCGNFVRTGDVRRPDELLCRWNQACLFETARILDKMASDLPSPLEGEGGGKMMSDHFPAG